MLRNSAKAHWTLSELGWTLQPPGNVEHWDGLSGWFTEYLAEHSDLAASSACLRKWLRATHTVQRGASGRPLSVTSRHARHRHQSNERA